MKSLTFPLLLVTLLASCSPSPEVPSVLMEAPDYSPIGEGIKVFSLAVLASVVVLGIVSLFNNNNHD